MYERVATLPYMSAAVDIARLILPGSQTQVRADQTRSSRMSHGVIGPVSMPILASAPAC